jgi:hypothetical protein
MSAKTLPKPKGITAQPINDKKNVAIGAKIKRELFALLGTISSFVTSFKPSAIGCNNPQIPTTFGPFRRCIAAIILRSANVKNATEITMGIITINERATECIKELNDIKKLIIPL